MDKVELAKMLGLEHCGYGENISVSKWEIEDVLEQEWETIDQGFSNGKIQISIEHEDFAANKLNIKHEDLIDECDVKVCIKQVSDLIWERAADEYLLRVKRAALLVGGE
jgi:hypothetical protein